MTNEINQTLKFYYTKTTYKVKTVYVKYALKIKKYILYIKKNSV